MRENYNYSFEGNKDIENKGVILFDIDNTLIDTKKLSFLAYTDIAEQTGLSLEKIIKIKNKYKSTLEKNTDFYPDDLINFLEKKTGQKIDNSFDKKDFYLESLFEGTVDILKKLQKTNKLGIYSEGFTDYQTKKLEFSGIIDFFDKDLIFIKRRKLDKDSLNEIPDGATVIDDNPKVIKKIRKIKRIKTVWFNKKISKGMEEVETIMRLKIN
ncbi:MAG: HAD hydrolase-like protein [Candidatus Shapirobacteria bacterium]|jgi:phosphoglycolate phosphatase-like HAD superfamily hydrolase